MHGLALPLLEDVVPRLLEHNSPDGKSEGAGQRRGMSAASSRLAALFTALESSLKALASVSVNAEAASLPSIPLVNIATLLCKLLDAVFDAWDCEVRHERFSACWYYNRTGHGTTCTIVV